MEPFLPWPGSKAKCAAEIVCEFPRSCGTYYEPFLGSGAVYFGMNGNLGFMKTEFQMARLSDINKNLINCWRAVRDNPEHVKKLLANHLAKNTEEFYNAMRSQMEMPSVFIYVMRAAFSSMYRENLKGQFNVPWRKQDFAVNNKPIAYDMGKLDMCAQYMERNGAYLYCEPWHDAVTSVDAGDLVYFDPPYLPYSEQGFAEYAAGGFGVGDHVMLSNTCRELQKKGAFVALSNSDTPDSRRLYGEPFKLINVSNAVKAKATTKGRRSEGLWIFKP